MYSIGIIYEKQQNLDQAAQWYKKAIDSGVSEAEEAYDRVISLIVEEAAQEEIMEDIMNEILNSLS